MSTQNENPVLAIFAMRSEIVNLKQAIASDNKLSVKASLRSCYSDAKKFFHGDKISLDDFKTKLQAIYSSLKSNGTEQALAQAERLFLQIELVITHFLDNGLFPDAAADQMSTVLAERVSGDLKKGVSKFDMAAGHYCQQVFAEMPEDRDDLMFGMTIMLKGIFLGQFADGCPAMELIKDKESQDEESENSIQLSTVIAKSLADKDMLFRLSEVSTKTSTPRLVHLTNQVVAMCEKVVGRPAETDALSHGYVGALAWMVIQTGLCLRHLIPEVTREIADELANDSQFRIINAVRGLRER